MQDKIRIEDLREGDVLLYRGTSPLSRAIQMFDGSPMSHAGLYLGGDRVGEAVARGLVERDCSTSFQGSEWVRAYRLVDAPEDMTPVLGRARHYLDEGNRYGYEQLLILGILCMTRKLEVTPVLRRLLRTLLDAAATELTRMLNAGKQPMICSEFVYRAYDEAESPIKDAYTIDIPGMLPLPQEEGAELLRAEVAAERRRVHPESLLAFVSAPASTVWIERPAHVPRLAATGQEPPDTALLDELIAAYEEEVETGETSRAYEEVTLGELRAAADGFTVSLYRAAQPAERSLAAAERMEIAAERSAAYDHLFRAAADFVTPADLYATSSLALLGAVEI